LRDYGVIEGGVDGRGFDDEGFPTRENVIIEEGVLKTYLHNSTTAKKFNTSSTGNAGIIDPHPWNLVVDPGSVSIDDMIREVKKGVMVTNNWYTRFQNLRSGEYSTIPRDAAFLIENGKIKHPVVGLRISDSLPRQLANIIAISKERRWIEWWEVSIPTLAPSMLIKSVMITKALG
jgi:PmbA protein